MLQDDKKITGEGVKEADNILDEVEIYSMPESFRLSYHKVNAAKKTGLVIIIAGSLFFIALSVVAYYYFFMKKPAEIPQENQRQEAPAAQEKKEQASSTAKDIIPEAKLETPKEAYLRLRRSAVSSLLSVPGLEEIGEITEEMNVGSSTAVLKIKTKKLDRDGLVTMAFDKEWRITGENWTESASSTPSVSTDFQPSRDSDSDGLSDKEEDLLGLDKNNKDSDGDTYADFSEMANSYNPAGDGKLSENAKIKQYAGKVFSYNVLYPAALTVNAAGGDESIMIKSPDNQFFQIIVQPNADKDDIRSWYGKQFDEKKTAALSGDDWEGIESDDGLIVYATDSKRNFIFTLTYNPGENEYLDYMGMFRIMIKNLNIAN